MMPVSEYIYRIAEVVKVTDGDTYWLRVDVGFRALVLINVRLNGYDCPEAHRGSDFERAEAVRARDYADNFLTSDLGLWVRTQKDPDSFGRWLGDIWNQYGTGLGEYLASYRLAAIWPTRWRDEYDEP